MLPDIELDQQSFEEIVEDAKKQIAKVHKMQHSTMTRRCFWLDLWELFAALPEVLSAAASPALIQWSWFP